MGVDMGTTLEMFVCLCICCVSVLIWFVLFCFVCFVCVNGCLCGCVCVFLFLRLVCLFCWLFVWRIVCFVVSLCVFVLVGWLVGWLVGLFVCLFVCLFVLLVCLCEWWFASLFLCLCLFWFGFVCFSLFCLFTLLFYLLVAGPGPNKFRMLLLIASMAGLVLIYSFYKGNVPRWESTAPGSEPWISGGIKTYQKTMGNLRGTTPQCHVSPKK